MHKKGSFQQTNAFAMHYGLLFGAIWILLFICSVHSFISWFYQLGTLFIPVLVPFWGFHFAKSFRRQTENDFPFTFRRALFFCLLIYFYAALLLTMAAFVYFQYLDNGAFWDSYLTYLQQPEMVKAMESAEMKAFLATVVSDGSIETLVALQRQTPALSFALGLFNLNILFGILLSLPTAWLAARKKS